MSFLEWLFWPRKALRQIHQKLDIIMATQIELTAKINAVNTQLQKISRESSATLAKVTELQVIIDGMDEVTPELQAAVDALAAQVQAVDDLTPDIITDGSGVVGGGENPPSDESSTPNRFRQ